MNENKNLPCAVARDLMPLYVENLTEDETTAMMREHISGCAACAQSYGMQKTKLEIEKQPKKPDFSGVRFFKKSYLKRVALWMVIAVMSLMLLLGGYSYLFTNYQIPEASVSIAGQYQLSDGRIVFALKAGDYSVNELQFYSNAYEEYLASDLTDGTVAMNVSCSFVMNRWNVLTRKADERGDIFYYAFDPSEVEEQGFGRSMRAFSTPAPVLIKEETESTVESQPILTGFYINSRNLWRVGDPLRKLSVEEEEVLLRAMEKAGFLSQGKLLPETDIIDKLMGK